MGARTAAGLLNKGSEAAAAAWGALRMASGMARTRYSNDTPQRRDWAGGETPWLLASSCLLVLPQCLPLATISSLVDVGPSQSQTVLPEICSEGCWGKDYWIVHLCFLRCGECLLENEARGEGRARRGRGALEAPGVLYVPATPEASAAPRLSCLHEVMDSLFFTVFYLACHLKLTHTH